MSASLSPLLYVYQNSHERNEPKYNKKNTESPSLPGPIHSVTLKSREPLFPREGIMAKFFTRVCANCAKGRCNKCHRAWLRGMNKKRMPDIVGICSCGCIGERIKAAVAKAAENTGDWKKIRPEEAGLRVQARLLNFINEANRAFHNKGSGRTNFRKPDGVSHTIDVLRESRQRPLDSYDMVTAYTQERSKELEAPKKKKCARRARRKR